MICRQRYDTLEMHHAAAKRSYIEVENNAVVLRVTVVAVMLNRRVRRQRQCVVGQKMLHVVAPHNGTAEGWQSHANHALTRGERRIAQQPLLFCRVVVWRSSKPNHVMRASPHQYARQYSVAKSCCLWCARDVINAS